MFVFVRVECAHWNALQFLKYIEIYFDSENELGAKREKKEKKIGNYDNKTMEKTIKCVRVTLY